MNHEIIIEKIVQSLSLEVEAMQNDSIVQLTSTSRRPPLKVKVKVRKKDKTDTYYNFIPVPKKHSAGTTVDKCRLVDSDQTLMSFDMFMDTDEALPTKKTRNKFFSLLRPGMCLGNTRDEKESYQPSKSQNNSITSKSDGLLEKHWALSKKDYHDLWTAESKRHQNFLGKCKPGGCLDPPFSEDKYSYTPIQNKLAASTFISKNLHLGDDNRISKQDLIIKPISKEKLPGIYADVKNIEEKPRNNSILNLYQAESIDTLMSTTYSNSIITYPPPLTSSEIRLYNEKNAQQRISADNRSRKSFNEFSQTYFIPPKAIMNHFGHRDSEQENLRTRDEKNSLERVVYLKNKTGSNMSTIQNVCQGVTRITASPTNTESYEEFANNERNLTAVPAGDNNTGRPVHNHKPIDTLFDKSDKNELPQVETPKVSTMYDLQCLKTTLKSETITIKSIDTLFKPSIRSSLAETNLNLKTLPEQLAQKENVILRNTLDTLPLHLEENTKTVDKRSSTLVISKNTCKNLYDHDEFEDNKALGEENNDLNQDYMVHLNYVNLDSNCQDNINSKLQIDINSQVCHVLEETQEVMNVNAVKEHLIPNNNILTDSNTTTALLKSIYIENDNVQIKTTTPFENELPSELKNLQQIQLVKNVDDYLASSDKEITKNGISNTSSGTEFDEKGSNENILSQDVIINPNMDTTKPESYEIIAPSDRSKDKRLNKDTSKYSDDYYFCNQNDEMDFTSSDKSKLTPESSLCSKNGEPMSIKNSIDKTSLPFTHSPLTRLSQDLLSDQKVQLKNYEQNNLDQYELEDPVRKASQVIPVLKKAFEDVVQKTSIQMTEDVFSTCSLLLQQNKDLPDIQTSPFHDSMTHENQDTVPLSIEKDISSSKESVLKEDIVPLTEINKKSFFYKLDPSLRSEQSKENLYGVDSMMTDVAKDQPQQLLHDLENQLKNKHNSQINQSAIRLFKEESKPSEGTVTIKQTLNTELGIKTANNSIMPNIHTVSNKEIFNKPTANLISYVDMNHNNTQNIPEPLYIHDSRKQMITQSETDSAKLIDEPLEHDSENTDQIKTADLSDIKPINLLINEIIRDAVESSILSQKISDEAIKDNIVSAITTEFCEPKFIKSERLEKQEKEAISVISPFLIDTTMDNTINRKDASYFKSSKIENESTVFDVVSFPDPKKLKEDIATLKHRSVSYTPSENTLTNSVKKDTITVDLAFHSYVNKKNEKFVKTFDSEKEPQRYSDDRVFIIKSDMNLSNNVMKIPIDSENSLFVQIKRDTEMDNIQKDVFKEVEKLCFKEEINSKKIHTAEPNDEIRVPNLHSIYEMELLPLQNAIKDLKEEIDYLAGHSLILKDNLHTRKLKPVRFTNINKRCVCLKRL